MLVAQAWESAQWFSGTSIDECKIADIHNMLRCAMENIILIGMPGSGKTTVGKHLAEKLGKTFIDADEKIVETAGISIPEIFKRSGEEGFRKIETQVLRELGAMSGIVLATGGGCVTRRENYSQLHQNGKIYYLQRDIEKLPTDGRPLSQANTLFDMFRIRKPLYHAFADHIVDNNHDVSTTVNTIIHQEKCYENSCD
jgi:shikimate dehydrogenase